MFYVTKVRISFCIWLSSTIKERTDPKVKRHKLKVTRIGGNDINQNHAMTQLCGNVYTLNTFITTWIFNVTICVLYQSVIMTREHFNIRQIPFLSSTLFLGFRRLKGKNTFTKPFLTSANGLFYVTLFIKQTILLQKIVQQTNTNSKLKMNKTNYYAVGHGHTWSRKQ